MDVWIKAIMALLNRGACWQGTEGANSKRCNMF